MILHVDRGRGGCPDTGTAFDSGTGHEYLRAGRRREAATGDGKPRKHAPTAGFHYNLPRTGGKDGNVKNITTAEIDGYKEKS